MLLLFKLSIPMFSNLQASLRESWLDDMMHVLEGEALGQDAATVEAAFKRHEAISTDVKARVSVKNVYTLAFRSALHPKGIVRAEVFVAIAF